MKTRIPLLFLFFSLSACVSSVERPSTSFVSKDVFVESRGVKIPATLVEPKTSGSTPLVVMIHGHGGTRHEAGGFTRVAGGLAAAGIASIRMDFPGCGDSTEPFSQNNITNMLEDIKASQAYANKVLQIDRSRVALLGFSMGGRIAMLLAKERPNYVAMAMWAPAAVNGADDMVKYLGGPDKYRAMKATAKREGYAPFTTFWGQDQQLGHQWFLDMENSRPLDAVADYPGELFVLYGDEDDVVPPHVSELVLTHATRSSNKERYVVIGADHGLGLFNEDHNSSRQAVDETVKFLTASLKRADQK